MLFTPENAKKVMNGSKWQTRRLANEGDSYSTTQPLNNIFIVLDSEGRKRWQVGQSYAIQPGRGKKSIGHRVLKSISRERLQDISEDDAIAEGVEPFDNPVFGPLYRPAFCSLWNEIYGKRPGCSWNDNPLVWVLEFERVSAEEAR